MHKIAFVLGDISQPKLGMSETEYEKLSDEVDVIFNLAVVSNWTSY